MACVNVASQISAILGGLEGYVLRRKRRIYESVTSSVQNDLKPYYEGGAPEDRASSSFGVFLLLLASCPSAPCPWSSLPAS